VDCGARTELDPSSYRICDACATSRIRDGLLLSDWPRDKLGQCAICDATPVVRAFPLPLCAVHASIDPEL